MLVKLSTGQTLKITFVHSSELETVRDGKLKIVQLHKRPNPSATRQRIDGLVEELNEYFKDGFRRLTLCEVAEVGTISDATGTSDEKAYLVLGEGWAVCHPNDVKDKRFSKPTGRKIALAGALKAAGIEFDQRKEVWKAYSQQFDENWRVAE